MNAFSVPMSHIVTPNKIIPKLLQQPPTNLWLKRVDSETSKRRSENVLYGIVAYIYHINQPFM